MNRAPLFLLALMLAPAALAQGMAPYDAALNANFDTLRRTLDAQLADTQHIDDLRHALDNLKIDPEQLDALRRTLDAQLAHPQRLDRLRQTLDSLQRTLDAELPGAPAPEIRSLDSQTPASHATPPPPRP